ncbi:MAG: hypothetical protein ABIP97_04135 [Chthoniobacterales bacterium]
MRKITFVILAGLSAVSLFASTPSASPAAPPTATPVVNPTPAPLPAVTTAPVTEPTPTPTPFPTPLTISCKPLPKFDPSEQKSVAKAFKNAEPSPFQQTWLPEKDKGFEPGNVRLGWKPDALWIYAVMDDADVSNPTTKMNEMQDLATTDAKHYRIVTTLLGDAFEMIVRQQEPAPYYEFHVTPQNQILQLKWLDWKDYGSTDWRPGAKNTFLSHLVEGAKLFTSNVWINRERKQWSVLISVPAELITGKKTISAGDMWLFTSARYDALSKDDPNPITSSTTLHFRSRNPRRFLSFHRADEWSHINFQK